MSAPFPHEAIDLENEGDLEGAFAILIALWRNGNRDRETALHLLFLSWYGIVEPRRATGFEESTAVRAELLRTFEEVHSYFERQIQTDAEMLYVVGLIAHMHWFVLNDSLKSAKVWEDRSKAYQQLYRSLSPGGIDPSIFYGRGAYGDYFSEHAAREGGY